MTAAYTVEAHFNPPRGVRGGLDGSPSDGWKLDAEGNRIEIAKADAIVLVPGERVVAVTAGGGGYGLPFERDPASVRDDVLEGWVSEARAAEVYGVILQQGGDRAVDEAATAAAREAARQPA
jgi:N-methylhydantoinase B